MSSRWTVPIVGALVAVVLIAVAVQSLTGHDEDGGSDPTTQGTAQAASTTTLAPTGPVDAVCVAHRDDLVAITSVITDLATQISEAQSPAELRNIAQQAQVTSDDLLAGLEEVRAEVAATPVPPEQVAGRDQIAGVLSELGFATAAFSTRTIEVLQQGDPAALEAYAPEATTSVNSLAQLGLRLGSIAAEAGAPACSFAVPAS